MVRVTDTEQLQAFFSRVYDVLIEHAGASHDEDDRFSFVFEFTGHKPSGAYPLSGSLGASGKFFFPAFNIGCRSEDRTVERERSITTTNEQLKSLAAEYRALTTRT